QHEPGDCRRVHTAAQQGDHISSKDVAQRRLLQNRPHTFTVKEKRRSRILALHRPEAKPPLPKKRETRAQDPAADRARRPRTPTRVSPCHSGVSASRALEHV